MGPIWYLRYYVTSFLLYLTVKVMPPGKYKNEFKDRVFSLKEEVSSAVLENDHKKVIKYKDMVLGYNFAVEQLGHIAIQFDKDGKRSYESAWAFTTLEALDGSLIALMKIADAEKGIQR